VGAEPVQIELEEITQAVTDGRIQGGESTYARFFALHQNECCPVINDAEHSLFLTSIIVAKDFWSDLEQDLQEQIKVAAMDAARSERRESIEDVDIVKAQCAKDDIKVVTMAAEERKKFEKATEYLYDKFDNMFSDGLLTKIREVK